MTAPPRPAARLVVGAALVDSLAAPRLLLAARRTAPAALAGMWEFPGGKVDPGETPEQALHRELAEELEVRVVLGEEVEATPGVEDPDHGRVWVLGSGYVLRLWLAELVDLAPPGLPVPREDHDELRWLAADQLGSVPWLPADAEAVRGLKCEVEGCSARFLGQAFCIDDSNVGAQRLGLDASRGLDDRGPARNSPGEHRSSRRLFGRRRMSPVVSPNKTWEGLGIGFAVGVARSGSRASTRTGWGGPTR